MPGSAVPITRGRLPPRGAWRPGFDPETDKIPTPTRDGGLVDNDQLVADVLATLDLTKFRFKRISNSHHVNPYARRYNHPDPTLNEMRHQFRNLRGQQIRLPVQFHNWIHEITIPADVQDHDVMEREIRIHRIGVSLRSRMSNVVAIEYPELAGPGRTAEEIEATAYAVDWDNLMDRHGPRLGALQAEAADLAHMDMYAGIDELPMAAMYARLGAIAGNEPIDYTPQFFGDGQNLRAA